MLGEQIGVDKGKVTGRRVLEGEFGPTVETSFESMGTVLGIESTGMGTYVSTMRQDGTLYGTGQGILMAKNGEKATWKGSGVGVFDDKGGLKFRGAIYYFSDGATLKKLNAVAVVYEHNVDAAGNTEGKIWEWR